MGHTQPGIAIPHDRFAAVGKGRDMMAKGLWVNSRTLRIAFAILLAILAAFWFEVDFSSSHQVARPAAIAQAAEGGTVVIPGQSRPTLSAIGSALTGGVVTALPPWGVLAVASGYLLSRLIYTHRRRHRRPPLRVAGRVSAPRQVLRAPLPVARRSSRLRG